MINTMQCTIMLLLVLGIVSSSRITHMKTDVN
jgi:hypothetical protein